MNKKVIIIGSGGHGSVIADIIRACGDSVVGFLDDDPKKQALGNLNDYGRFSDCEFVIGIGDSKIRERIGELSCVWYTAIHPSAVVSPSAEIGKGTVVMPNAVINSNAKIGNHCIINSGAIVEHDNVLGDYVHVSVGARLGGTVKIENSTMVGIGATVSNNIHICSGTLVGAGAVVVKNIENPGTYVGVPAGQIK